MSNKFEEFIKTLSPDDAAEAMRMLKAKAGKRKQTRRPKQKETKVSQEEQYTEAPLEPVETRARKIRSGNDVKTAKRDKEQNLGRTESIIRGSRENRFFELGLENSDGDIQNARKHDKKLNANKNVGPRIKKPRTRVEIECDRCGDLYDVAIQFVKDSDTGRYYICDSCQDRKNR